MVTLQEAYVDMQKSNKKKVKESFLKTFISGIFAGAFIAVVGHIYVLSAMHFSDNVFIGKFIGALIFPIGIYLVVLTKSQLFTSNILCFDNILEKESSSFAISKNWLMVYFSNFVGAFIFAYMMYSGDFYTGVHPESFLAKLSEAKIHHSFISLVFLGFCCNVVVCGAVFFSYLSSTAMGKFILLWAPVAVFVIAGFEHSVANMFYTSIISIVKGSDIFMNIVCSNLIPVTIGNILGGIAILTYVRLQK